MSVEKKELNQREYRLQVHIIERHAEYFPHVIITHVPNRPSDGADGFFKQQLGVRPGVTDLVLWWGYVYPGWAVKWLAKMVAYLGFGFSRMHSGVVELKVDTNPSSEQNKFMSAIHFIGGKEGVVRSWEQYYRLLCSWKIEPAYECTIFDEPDYRTKEQKFADAYNCFKPA